MRVCLSVLGAAKTERDIIHVANHLFCNDWRMRQMNCVNKPAGKQFPTLGLPEI